MWKILVRVVSVLPAVALQALFIFLLGKWFYPYAATITMILTVLAAFLVLYIVTKREDDSYKILWLIIILGFPIGGTVLYLLFGRKRTARGLRLALEARESVPTVDNKAVCDEIRAAEPRLYQSLKVVSDKTGYPVLKNRETKYYPLGDDMFPDMLEAIREAKNFIYVEYFIFTPGVMLNTIADLLAEKAAAGVDVRVIYDDFGSISTYSRKDAIEQFTKRGIQVFAFNPFLAVHGTLNYRDHRKMLVVDGEIAFTGGINLADEYINQKQRFGIWKDIGFRIKGQPVLSFVKMFEDFWSAFAPSRYNKESNYDKCSFPESDEPGDGYVLSFYDKPTDYNMVSYDLYLDLLSQATDYAYFYTPYLLLSDTLLDSFIAAARRGVDVRIIMPGIPDKKFIFKMSRSYYQPLLEAGVKIYEYTPGFVHAKAAIVDDKICTLGTVNLDYRGLFMHFENNSLFYNSAILFDLKADYLETQAQCVEVSPYDRKKHKLRWIVDGILHLFAPLC